MRPKEFGKLAPATRQKRTGIELSLFGLTMAVTMLPQASAQPRGAGRPSPRHTACGCRQSRLSKRAGRRRRSAPRGIAAGPPRAPVFCTPATILCRIAGRRRCGHRPQTAALGEQRRRRYAELYLDDRGERHRPRRCMATPRDRALVGRWRERELDVVAAVTAAARRAARRRRLPCVPPPGSSISG